MRSLTILGIFTCVGLLIAPPAVLGDPQVTIVNPLPLPITGDVTVAGDVEITNTEENPVSVIVTNGNGAVTQPVQFSGSFLIYNGSISGCDGASDTYMVPSGQQLAVEYVSIRVMDLDLDDTVDVDVRTQVGDYNQAHYLGVAEPQGRIKIDFAGSDDQFISKQVRFYADSDTNVFICASRAKRNYGPDIYIMYTMVGYLTDIL